MSLEILLVCNGGLLVGVLYRLPGDSVEQPVWGAAQLFCQGQEIGCPFDLSVSHSILKLFFMGFPGANVVGAEGIPPVRLTRSVLWMLRKLQTIIFYLVCDLIKPTEKYLESRCRRTFSHVVSLEPHSNLGRAD